MKFFGITIIALFICMHVKGQDIKWTYNEKKIDDTTCELHISAAIQPPWHIYSEYMEEGGPVATKITFTPNAMFILKGDVSEKGTAVAGHEDVFNVNVRYYENSVDFIQTVIIKYGSSPIISGFIRYMICTQDHCMPPTDLPFSIQMK
jgi:hypothetical protein